MRSSPTSAALAATVALALIGNAAFCGVISNPHDRYGSRMAWIAVFAVGLTAWRVCAIARERYKNAQTGRNFDGLMKF